VEAEWKRAEEERAEEERAEVEVKADWKAAVEEAEADAKGVVEHWLRRQKKNGKKQYKTQGMRREFWP